MRKPYITDKVLEQLGFSKYDDGFNPGGHVMTFSDGAKLLLYGVMHIYMEEDDYGEPLIAKDAYFIGSDSPSMGMAFVHEIQEYIEKSFPQYIDEYNRRHRDSGLIIEVPNIEQINCKWREVTDEDYFFGPGAIVTHTYLGTFYASIDSRVDIFCLESERYFSEKFDSFDEAIQFVDGYIKHRTQKIIDLQAPKK